MVQYAYVTGSTVCKHCLDGSKHFYMTNKHIIVVGSKEELEHANFPLKIEIYDPSKSDIKVCMNIFGHWPELDNVTQDGISKNVGSSLPMYSHGFNLSEIKVSKDKNEVTITYRR